MKKIILAFSCLSLTALGGWAQEKPASTPFPGAQFGKPARIPGVIQAENFDEGPEGVAYHNVPPIQMGDDPYRKLGLAYRKTDVELEIAYGTNMLAAVRDGEWWKYTVEVLEDAVYELDLVTSGWRRGNDAGTIRVEFDGVDLLGLVRVPFTGRWQDFSTLTFPGIKLTKGIHELKVIAVNANDIINLDLYRFRKTVTAPFKGIYHRVPGFIQAEDFAEGPAGLAFHNVDPVIDADAKAGPRFLGLQYRKTPVELEQAAGVMMIAGIREGEWWDYILQVDKDGTYDIEVIYSRWDSKEKDAAISLEYTDAKLLNPGKVKTGLIDLPLTPGGKWFLFGTHKIPGITLKKGYQTMRVKNEKGQQVINLDGFRFIEVEK
jgi:hypothetical protein